MNAQIGVLSLHAFPEFFTVMNGSPLVPLPKNR